MDTESMTTETAGTSEISEDAESNSQAVSDVQDSSQTSEAMIPSTDVVSDKPSPSVPDTPVPAKPDPPPAVSEQPKPTPPPEPEPEKSDPPTEPVQPQNPASQTSGPSDVPSETSKREPDMELEYRRIIREVKEYAQSYTSKGFTFVWDESLVFGWETGYMGTPRVKYEGVDGVIATLKYHVDKIVNTVTDPANGVTVTTLSYKVMQVTVDGDIAFVVLYG